MVHPALPAEQTAHVKSLAYRYVTAQQVFEG